MVGKRPLLPLLFVVLMAVLALTPPADQMERDFGLPWLYTIRGAEPAPEGVLIVGVDQASVSWLQRSAGQLDISAPRLGDCLGPNARIELARARGVDALPRGVHACLVDLLTASGAALIVFDIAFGLALPDDAAFAEAIRRSGRVLLFEKVAMPTLTGDPGQVVVIRQQPAETLRNAAMGTVGFHVESVTGRPTTRYLTGFEQLPDLPSIPVAAFRHMTGTEPEVAAREHFRLYGAGGTLPIRSLRTVFGADAAPLPPLEGTVVFVGRAEHGQLPVDDGFLVPTSTPGNETMAGVELAATAYLNLRDDHRLHALAPWARAVLVALVAAALVWAGTLADWRLALALQGGVAVAAVALAAGLFTAGHWIPVVQPLAVCLPLALLLWLGQRMQRASRAARAMGPRSYIDALLTGRPSDRRHAIASAMFVDVAGSTALAQEYGPDVFSRTLEDYYGRVCRAVEREGGVVFEARGDGVLSLFFRDEIGEGFARAACHAAVAIIDDLSRQSGGVDDLPPIRVRIGVATGTTIAGPLRIGGRLSVTAVGDPVNSAARLQDLARDQMNGTFVSAHPCLIDDETANSANIDDALLRPMGTRVLRGRSQPTPVFLLAPESALESGQK
ncbi:MAG: adenylate/guanylate cyclase domain-containing protein [Pseudomonadota bacterium]